MSSTLFASATASAVASATASAVSDAAQKPASYKLIGVLLAIGSGCFIGVSFVVKKKGLLAATAANGNAAGEGLSYLKSWIWWTGMSLMIIGEILNFIAYAFTEAILVTPLGALSVVICAVLSSIFLKEKLTFFGKIGCLLAILGATLVALNGPQDSSAPATIKAFQAQFLSVGFLVFGSLVIAISLGLIFFVAPKYGKTHMLVYITICSLIGGLSVVCTSGLGSAILTSIRGDSQVSWFFFFLLGFVILTLLAEVVYLNKALALFNTALVTPVYYATFTGSTIVTSIVLHKGFDAGAVDIVNVVLGFLVVVAGVILLQLSKANVAEEVVGGSLDRRSSMLLTASRSRIYQDGDREKTLEAEDPGMDALRGGFGAIGSIHRALSYKRSMRREARFDPSEVARRKNGAPGAAGSGPSEMAMNTLRGVQLYDNPMPIDSADKISLHSSRFASGDDSQRPRSASIQFAPSDAVHMYPTNMRGAAQHSDMTRLPGSHQHLSPLASPIPAGTDIGVLSTQDTGRFPRSESPTEMGNYRDPFNAKDDDEHDDVAVEPHRGRFNLRKFSKEREPSREGHRTHRPAGPRDMDRDESERLVGRRDSVDSDRGGLERFDSRDVL